MATSDNITRAEARERAVFLLMGAGRDPKEIASELGLNLKTVETYRRRIREGCDHFIDMGTLEAPECARRIAADGIHALAVLRLYVARAHAERFGEIARTAR